jgi:hypothetical protein
VNARLVAVGAVGAALAGMFTLGRASAPATETETPRCGGGSPARSAEPEVAAVAAVVGEVEGHRTGDAAAAERALLRRATAEDGPRLVRRLRDQESAIAEAWPGGPTGWWVAPLATRTVHHGRDTARVEVWFAEVISPPGVDAMGDWRVTTVDLRRHGDEWLVADLTDRYGPVLRTRPASPASSAGLAGFVDGFAVIDHG